ncbi:MAG: BatD family protein [Rariglobus sp.]
MFKTLFLSFALPLLFVFALAGAHAQSVRWEPGSGTLAHNQVSDLTLVFDQCEPKGTVALPVVDGLTFSAPNTSENSSFTVLNGKASRSRTVTLTYRVRPTERRSLTLPAFAVETDKGSLSVAAATFEVGDATVGESGLSLDTVAQSRFALPTGQVWAGEVFSLSYSLNVIRRYFYQLGSDLEWNPAPLTVETWAKPELLETNINNEHRVSIVYKTRAYAKAPGTVALNPATQLVNLTTGSTGFNIFGRASLEQRALTSQPASLTVRPLPAPAPNGFSGAVGKFKLASNVVPLTATVGEPITWTLTLDGTGNWPDVAGLPARAVSKDFRVIQPQAKRTNQGTALFEANITEDIVLIPTKPGTYTLGPVTYTTFNPGTGAYETLTTKPFTVRITAAAGQSPATGPTTPASTNGSDSTDPQLKTPVPTVAAPAALPRDPLPLGRTAIAPITNTTLIACALAAILLPLITWLTLALHRARATDPGLPLRQAHIRLSDTVRQIAATDLAIEHPASTGAAPSQLAVLLQRWQRDAALLFQLPQAVPTPNSFLTAPHPAKGDTDWSTLWAEADRTLYGAAPLPADWTARATAALDQHRAPTFSPAQLFLPRNLLPLLAVIVALAASVPASVAADSTAAYAQGDFPAAETALRETLAAAPTDWAAHHNLALTLIQQNRPEEAAGHALAAFVQQPQTPSVRWHLAYSFKTAGVSPAELKPFLADSPAATIARLASPTRWQALLIASAWLAALATALGIRAAYKRSGSSRKLKAFTPLTTTLTVSALIVGLAAGLSLRTYGTLAHSRAVMVVKSTTLRSIPTELDTPQKSTPLSLGLIATTDKTFLGWQRLTFPDGQTGWARTETVVPLWNAISPKP